MCPYQLVYEKACHLPVELQHKVYWAIQKLNFDQTTTGEKRLLHWMNSDYKHMSARSCIKKRSRNGMTRKSYRKSSNWGSQYSCSIQDWDYFLESSNLDGRVHLLSKGSSHMASLSYTVGIHWRRLKSTVIDWSIIGVATSKMMSSQSHLPTRHE